MKKIINKCITGLCLLVLLNFYSCDNYLDVVPENDITTIESIFEKRNTAMSFFYGCYNRYQNAGGLGVSPASVATDEFTTGSVLRNSLYSKVPTATYPFDITSGLQNSAVPIGATWDGKASPYQAIRNCNIFIANIDKVHGMTEKEIGQYKGSAKAIKALYYFDLVKQYGPICLIPENANIEAPIETMQVPRSHIDTCFKRIVQLFDEAIEDGIHTSAELPAMELGLLTREAVMAYKAKALLWQASPLFNGNPAYSDFVNRDGKKLFNPNVDLKKWEAAGIAADEAVAYCELMGKKLNSGYSQESSTFLNTIRDIQRSTLPIRFESTELLHGMYTINGGDIAIRIPRFSAGHDYETPSSRTTQGLLCPTYDIVKQFYTKNGLPVEYDNDAHWSASPEKEISIETDFRYKNIVDLNSNILKFHLQRELRFYANVGFDGGIWNLGGEYIKLEPFMGGANGPESVSIAPGDMVNITGYWCKKFVSPSNFTKGTSEDLKPVAPYAKLRLAELYLIQAEAWNEFEGPSDKVYDALNKVRERAGIPTVQNAWENLSKAPTKHKDQGGLREIIKQERTIELVFEGHRYWDLRRWLDAEKYLGKPSKGWNVTGAQGEPFYNSLRGPMDVWTDNKFSSPRDYLWPLSTANVLKANIVQNPGW